MNFNVSFSFIYKTGGKYDKTDIVIELLDGVNENETSTKIEQEKYKEYEDNTEHKKEFEEKTTTTKELILTSPRNENVDTVVPSIRKTNSSQIRFNFMAKFRKEISAKTIALVVLALSLIGGSQLLYWGYCDRHATNGKESRKNCSPPSAEANLDFDINDCASMVIEEKKQLQIPSWLENSKYICH